MTPERKAQLIAQARRALPRGKALDDYINFINNYEQRVAENDRRIRERYHCADVVIPQQIQTL